MIVVSLLLILVSGGLLATGILQANDPFVMASIGVSVLAAAALFLGIRQQRGTDRPAGQNMAGDRAQPADAGRAHPAGIGDSTGAERRRTPATASQPVGPPPVARPATGSAAVGSVAPPTRPPERPARTVRPAVLDQATTRIDRSAVEAGRPSGPAGPGANRPGDRQPANRPADDVTEIVNAGEATEIIDRPAKATPSTPDVDHEQTTRLSPEDRTAPASTSPAGVAANVAVAGKAAEDEAPATETQIIDVEPPASAAEPDDPDEPDELDDDEDPPDEPAAELLMASEVSRLSSLDHEVLVVDGRPRYHLSGCPHLADKESQPLPVSEAVELGFTACSLCGAATAVLAEAKQQ